MTLNGDVPSQKPRKRAASKPASRQNVERVKLTLYLDADLAKKFTVHAAMTGLDRSELFAELVKGGCKRFVVSDRERGPIEAIEPDAA